MVFVFILIFLTSWTGGAWFPQFGPVWLGVHWLPFLLTAVFVVKLLFAVVCPKASRTQCRATEQTVPEINSQISPDVFFWVLVIGLSISIIIH